MKFAVSVICGSLAFFLLVIITQEDELVEKWVTASRNLLDMQKDDGSLADYIRGKQYEKEAVGLSVLRAFETPQYDRPDSLLAVLLETPSLSFSAAAKACAIQFPRAPVSNRERARLCNFMVHTLYESRLTNTNYCDGIRIVLLGNDDPGAYSTQTREIVKKLVLEGQLHFSYSAIVGITKDQDVRRYLSAVMNGTESNKRKGFAEAWMAACMLAKAGDKIAHKQVEDVADGLTNLHKAMYVPLGMAYIGDKAMVLRLFKMLESDLNKWNGEDVMPEKTQLAHEAAAVLSLCVKGFPVYTPFDKFTSVDKAKCLKWVEENKDRLEIENKPPLDYFKNTRFDSLTR